MLRHRTGTKANLREAPEERPLPGAGSCGTGARFTPVSGGSLLQSASHGGEESASRCVRAPRIHPIGAVAQLGERLNGIQEVDGSIPFGSTNRIDEIRATFVRLSLSDRAGFPIGPISGRHCRRPASVCPLISSGIIDSFGLLEVIAFLEDSFHVTIDPSPQVLRDFDTVNGMVAVVDRSRRAG
jgi:hypothetical protein